MASALPDTKWGGLATASGSRHTARPTPWGPPQSTNNEGPMARGHQSRPAPPVAVCLGFRLVRRELPREGGTRQSAGYGGHSRAGSPIHLNASLGQTRRECHSRPPVGARLREPASTKETVDAAITSVPRPLFWNQSILKTVQEITAASRFVRNFILSSHSIYWKCKACSIRLYVAPYHT